MALGILAPGYVPRIGERSVLHNAVRENVETFLANARERTEHGFGVPHFVEDELRGFLKCGVLAHGFIRVRCGACGDELLVAFSCKGRAVCPSCTSRRASDCAAHLVNNLGAAACARSLEKWRARGRVQIPIGVNIGKSKVVPNEQAADDYRESFTTIADVADYVVVNVSSPNTPGLRDLQKEDELARILEAVAEPNRARASPRPLFVKLAPDLALNHALACAAVATAAGCAGLVVSNTTISRDGLVSRAPEGPGGISGAPLFARSTEMLRALAAAHPWLAFIGVGGIEDGATLRAKLDAGAVLAQSYTGFVYGGPGWVRRTLRALVDARALPPSPGPRPPGSCVPEAIPVKIALT